MPVRASLLLVLVAHLARADETPLALQVVDPAAFLLELEFENEWTPSYWGVSGSSDAFHFRVTVPSHAWGRQNVTRVTIPFDVSTREGDTGLGTTEIVNLLLFRPGWGTFGGGFSMSLSPSGESQSAFQIGPALGFTVEPGNWKMGLFLRNFLGRAAATTSFQPILSYAPADWISIGIGELEIVADWWNTSLAALPLGLELDLVPTIDGQRLHLSLNPQLNLANGSGNYQWRFTVGIAIIGGE
jgi:hypothetical protein